MKREEEKENEIRKEIERMWKGEGMEKERGKLGFIPEWVRASWALLLLWASVWGVPGSMVFWARSRCRQAAHSSGCSSGPGHRSNPHCGAKSRKTRRSRHARCALLRTGVLFSLYLRTRCTCIHIKETILALIISYENLQTARNVLTVMPIFFLFKAW